jgi:hypothetical protein
VSKLQPLVRSKFHLKRAAHFSLMWMLTAAASAMPVVPAGGSSDAAARIIGAVSSLPEKVL